MDEISQLQELIDNAKNIVFFGGAGVSTESGILDFRSEKGLYNLKSKYDKPYEVMLSHSYYENNTEIFFKFYKEFMINKEAKPNSAHKYLAKLEKRKNLTIITQNIDGLHQMASSKNVIELHGSIHRNYCTNCMRNYNLDEFLSLGDVPLCPHCKKIVKPDVVLYEEPLEESTTTKAIIKLSEADLLIVAGTSLSVYPAASFLSYFFGDNIVLINKDEVPLHRKIKLKIKGNVGEIFSKLR